MKPNTNLSSVTQIDSIRFKQFLSTYQNKQSRTLWRYIYYLKKIPNDLLVKQRDSQNKESIKRNTLLLIEYFRDNSGLNDSFNFIKNIRLVVHAICLYLKAYDNYEASTYLYERTKSLQQKSSVKKSVKWVEPRIIEEILRCSKYTVRGKGHKVIAKPEHDAMRDWLIIKLLTTTGSRIAETLQYKFEDVYIDKDDAAKIEYYKIRFKGIGKGGKSGYRRITRDVYLKILSFKREFNLKDNDVIFRYELEDNYTDKLANVMIAGKSSSSIYLLERRIEKFRYMIKKLGVASKHYSMDNTITPHMFRHALGMILKRAGWELDEIQKQLDHSDISTTQIYAHVEDREMDEKFTKTMED